MRKTLLTLAALGALAGSAGCTPQAEALGRGAALSWGDAYLRENARQRAIQNAGGQQGNIIITNNQPRSVGEYYIDKNMLITEQDKIEAKAIYRVMVMMSKLSGMDEVTEGRKMDLSGCPADFQETHKELLNAKETYWPHRKESAKKVQPYWNRVTQLRAKLRNIAFREGVRD